jgi:trehalose/maltose hydrolase-like predicted phosphorylase
VTTLVDWESPSGRRTLLQYDVLLDRGSPRVGTVRLSITPQWNGDARVTDLLGEGFDYHPDFITAGLRRGTESVDSAQRSAALTVRTRGTDIRVAYADRLDVPSGASVTGSTAPHQTRLRASFPVTSGQTYSVTKTVGLATSQDAADPVAVANSSANGAAPQGFEALQAESGAAWAQLWQSDILVPGRPVLQRAIRTAQFYLMSSVALPGDPGQGWSLSPVGLSGDGYNNHVFWDAETWMYPALLALHPDLARSVVDYRYNTRSGARQNAEDTGYRGMRFAWESALDGVEVTPTWAETGRLEQHITGDVALAQWQYYLATGDDAWLADRGYPVIRGAAAFWASRATRNADGSWSIKHLEGPDEYHFPVDDSVYTNVAARTTLRLAERAAAITGGTTPARWERIADGLRVLAPHPLGGHCCVRPEFAGYNGDQVKQADAVMLTYPWEVEQSHQVDLSVLRYYAARYDPDGPAMTDSVNSIVWSQTRPAGCANWSWTRRSLDPFAVPPYSQFTEARSGQGVFTFLTGEGGFLQEMLYGYPGLRWQPGVGPDGPLTFDPTLPPQLAGGLTVRGLHWQGRTIDVEIDRATTTISQTSGAPTTVSVRGQEHPLSTATPVTVQTARPDEKDPADLSLCRPVRSSSADPSYPPEAAVDGETVVGWAPAGADGSLVVQLTDGATPGQATVTWTGKGQATYRVQLAGADGWQTVGRGQVSGPSTQHLSWKPWPSRQGRVLLNQSKAGLQIGELVVR